MNSSINKIPVIIVLLICIHTQSEYVRDYKDAVQNFLPLAREMGADCVDGYGTSVYLPYGRGEADSSVITITDRETNLNCSIRYIRGIKDIGFDIILVVVIEFEVYVGIAPFCTNLIGEVVLMIGEPPIEKNICEHRRRASRAGREGNLEDVIYVYPVNQSELEVRIIVQKMSGSMKFTVTTARNLPFNEHCDPDIEVSCELSTGGVCISRILSCDGNINCGFPEDYDEELKFCDSGRTESLWKVAGYGVLTTAICVFLFIQLLRVCVPSVSDNFFIFNEDEDNKLILTTQLLPPLDSTPQEQIELHIISKMKLNSEETDDVEGDIEAAETDPSKPPKKQRFVTEIEQYI